MTPRQRRMTLVLGIVAGVAIAGALALSAFRSNVTFFFDPTQVAAGQVKSGERFRLGGMVTEGSVKRTPGSLEVRFVVTDFKHEVPVSYTGVLPDLFREGTGVVAHGKMRSDGTFVADEVLAKHDEKYMPPEVARSLKRRHGEAREEALTTAPPAGAAAAGAGTERGQPNEAGAAAQSPSTTSTKTPRVPGGASTAHQDAQVIVSSAIAPAVAVSQTRAAAVSQAPAVAVSQTPGAAVSQAPPAAVSQTPGAAVSQAPPAAVSQTPGAAVSQTPGAAVSQTPAAAVSQAPGAAVSQAPGAAVSQTPTAAVSQTPAFAVSQTPAAAHEAATPSAAIPHPSRQAAIGGTATRPTSGGL